MERLVLKHDEALSEIRKLGVEAIDAGIVRDDYDYASGKKAISILEGKKFSSVVICIAGWIPTHAVIQVIDHFREKPMLLWGLCGWKEDGRIVTTAEQAGTSALRPAMEEMDFKFRFVYNSIGKEMPMLKIDAFLKAASAAQNLRTARIGSMGYRDMLLYGTAYDAAAIRRVFGTEAENFEMLEMVQNLEKVKPAEIDKIVSYIRKNWDIIKPCDDEVIRKGAGYALAIGKRIKERGYSAVTINDVDGMKKLLGFPPAMVLMLLKHLYDVETTPENDVMGNLTQLMNKFITGETAHYMEYYEYFDDSMLIGVPDYVPETVVDGKVKMLPAAFGLLNSSLLNVSKVKTGYVTCSRLAMKKGKFVLHVYTGTAVAPPSWEEFGWDKPAPQLSSLRVIPDSCTVEQFAQNVQSQHVIVSYGNQAEALKDLCAILGIEVIY